MEAHLSALGAESLLLQSETESKSELAALQFFFLHEKVIFLFHHQSTGSAQRVQEAERAK